MRNLETKKQKKTKAVEMVNALAFNLMSSSVNSACIWIHHQPKVPAEAKKFRKF